MFRIIYQLFSSINIQQQPNWSNQLTTRYLSTSLGSTESQPGNTNQHRSLLWSQLSHQGNVPRTFAVTPRPPHWHSQWQTNK